MFLITSMIRVNKQTHVHLFSSRLWGIRRLWLLNFTIEVFPISLDKIRHINIRIRWIKYKTGIMLLLQISKDMKQCFQVPFSWHSHMRCKYGNFSDNVNTSKFNNPMNYTNFRLIVVSHVMT